MSEHNVPKKVGDWYTLRCGNRIELVSEDPEGKSEEWKARQCRGVRVFTVKTQGKRYSFEPSGDGDFNVQITDITE